MKQYQEIVKNELADYIKDQNSCAAQLTKAWINGGLTDGESMIFCKKWMAKNKPGRTWGSKLSHITAHRNWLFNKWIYTAKSPQGKIVVQTKW